MQIRNPDFKIKIQISQSNALWAKRQRRKKGFFAIFLLKVLRLTDPSYLLKKLKLREETNTGAEATSNDEKPEEVSSVSACEFHFSLNSSWLAKVLVFSFIIIINFMDEG